MRFSLRALNRCRDCEDTFEAPLGEDLTSRCPFCNSPATEVVARSSTRPFLDSALGCFILAGVVVVGVGIGAVAMSARIAAMLGGAAVHHRADH